MPYENNHGTVIREKTFTVKIMLCQNNGTKENPNWVKIPEWAKPVRQEKGGLAYLSSRGLKYCSYRQIGPDIFKEVQKLNGFKDNKKK